MSDQSTCRGCGQPVLWVTTEKGAKMPLSIASKQKRFVVQPMAGDAMLGKMVDTYLSHFGDCPASAQFKREKGNAD
jgi:hypothetical protein